tara:strand:- start:698 stop:907 length:210 start_codon:yes stop_codon:yes gene_type:complete
MHRNIFLKKIKKNVKIGVTGVTGLVSLIQLQKWVTPWCNRGVTGVTVKPLRETFLGFYLSFLLKTSYTL